MKLAAAITIALMVPALAAEPIDFTQKLYGATGKPLTQGGDDCKAGQVPGRDCSVSEMTLEDATIQALELPVESDRGEDARKKFERDELARRIYADPKHVALSVDEIAAIKDRIGKVWNAPQIGAAWRLLDPTIDQKR